MVRIIKIAKLFVAALTLVIIPVLLSGLLSITNVSAAELEKATGKVLLKVTGNISNTNVEGEAWFDLEMLQGLGVTTIKTETPWTQGTAEFSGVLLKDLLTAVGAGSTDFQAIALNEYKFDFGGIDYEEYPVIIAWKLNDELLTIRTLGPLWIMFPYKDFPQLNTETFKNAAVWQLIELAID